MPLNGAAIRAIEDLPAERDFGPNSVSPAGSVGCYTSATGAQQPLVSDENGGSLTCRFGQR